MAVWLARATEQPCSLAAASQSQLATPAGPFRTLVGILDKLVFSKCVVRNHYFPRSEIRCFSTHTMTLTLNTSRSKAMYNQCTITGNLRHVQAYACHSCCSLHFQLSERIKKQYFSFQIELFSNVHTFSCVSN